MYSKFWPKGGLPGVLHHYTETLTTFEYTSAASQPHSILFVGGLGDGLATTSYMADVVASLRSTPWSLFTLTLTSSYQSWGMGHLDRDTDEIATCLKYIKEYKDDKFGKDNQNKIVLMGHSTGSQCVLHYLHRENPHTTKPKFDPYLEHVVRVPLDGAIMQAPVSDREAIQWVLRTGFGKKTPQEIQAIFAKMEAAAREGAKKQLTQNEDVLMPLELTGHIYPSNTPLSCRRFLSLISPESPEKPAEDDLFSSDLSDEHLATTFGMIHTRGLLKGKLMAMPSGKDASVPIWVDKDALMGRWKKAADHNGKYSYWSDRSAQIPNGSHALSNDDQAEPRQFLCRKVLGFLGEIVPATTEEATDAEKGSDRQGLSETKMPARKASDASSATKVGLDDVFEGKEKSEYAQRGEDPSDSVHEGEIDVDASASSSRRSTSLAKRIVEKMSCF